MFYDPPVTNHDPPVSTLLCKEIARVPGGHKRFMLTKLGGMQNRIDPASANEHNRTRRIDNSVFTDKIQITPVFFEK